MLLLCDRKFEECNLPVLYTQKAQAKIEYVCAHVWGCVCVCACVCLHHLFSSSIISLRNMPYFFFFNFHMSFLMWKVVFSFSLSNCLFLLLFWATFIYLSWNKIIKTGNKWPVFIWKGWLEHCLRSIALNCSFHLIYHKVKFWPSIWVREKQLAGQMINEK